MPSYRSCWLLTDALRHPSKIVRALPSSMHFVDKLERKLKKERKGMAELGLHAVVYQTLL